MPEKMTIHNGGLREPSSKLPVGADIPYALASSSQTSGIDVNLYDETEYHMQ